MVIGGVTRGTSSKRLGRCLFDPGSVRCTVKVDSKVESGLKVGVGFTLEEEPEEVDPAVDTEDIGRKDPEPFKVVSADVFAVNLDDDDDAACLLSGPPDLAVGLNKLEASLARL